jgi:hypothetical protein
MAPTITPILSLLIPPTITIILWNSSPLSHPTITPFSHLSALSPWISLPFSHLSAISSFFDYQHMVFGGWPPALQPTPRTLAFYRFLAKYMQSFVHRTMSLQYSDEMASANLVRAPMPQLFLRLWITADVLHETVTQCITTYASYSNTKRNVTTSWWPPLAMPRTPN